MLKLSMTYAQSRKILQLPDSAFFKGLLYRKENAESAILMEMKAYNTIRRVLEKAGLKIEWQSVANKTDLLDGIGTAFSFYKTDAGITTYLDNKLPDTVLQALLAELNFDKFIHLSLTALKKFLRIWSKEQVMIKHVPRFTVIIMVIKKKMKINFFLKYPANKFVIQLFCAVFPKPVKSLMA